MERWHYSPAISGAGNRVRKQMFQWFLTLSNLLHTHSTPNTTFTTYSYLSEPYLACMLTFFPACGVHFCIFHGTPRDTYMHCIIDFEYTAQGRLDMKNNHHRWQLVHRCIHFVSSAWWRQMLGSGLFHIVSLYFALKIYQISGTVLW